ncbi:TetR/AcrR family transcriptional regulator [Metabacillus litoralis]|uniref:TetR/AcrR family transcriptional regulator n=1 Tax=Metabacillus litoralis TaxID=152268 RepID=A0A5C6VLU7_9BACI|nr:TetR/AcrR family transcriptional regulator [Metabacillus litoralis]TXC85980.1 TetR/AcrR family transcriptional regulator [Metabacillus litoralis]
MPKFNDIEKENIKKELMSKGKELFLLNGLRKTSIDNITEECSIAKGSFYTFFSSKEELFSEIWLAEEKKYNLYLKDIMMTTKDTKKMIINICRATFDYLELNPFHKNLIERNEIDYLFRKLPADQYKKLVDQDLFTFLPLLEELQNEGKLKKIDPEIIMGIHRCLSYLPLLKKEVGADIFPKVVDSLINMIADGLTNQNNEEFTQ